MTRFWLGGKGPREIAHWAYMYLVTNLKIEPDYLSQMKSVEQMSFEGDTPVILIRIFDPKALPKTTVIENFVSLDQHPDLIIFEGHMEKESGKIHFHARQQATPQPQAKIC